MAFNITWLDRTDLKTPLNATYVAFASIYNTLKAWIVSPVQKITDAFVDTDIIVDGTKEYSTTKVIAGATHTITASDDDAIADTLSAEHKQGNELRVRYQFDVDCTITLVNFESTGNNTGTITPIPAGSYNFKFQANARGVNLVIPQNAGGGNDTTKLSKTDTDPQTVAGDVEFNQNVSADKLAANVAAQLNALDVTEAAIGSGYGGIMTAPTDGMIIEGYIGGGEENPQSPLHLKTTSSVLLVILESPGDTGFLFREGNQPRMIFRYENGADVLQAYSYKITENIFNISENGPVGIRVINALAGLDIHQPDSVAAIPPLKLTQADLSEEMIKFDATIATGNPIEAVAAKTLTPTHFIKVNIEGVGERYIQAGTIA